MYFTCEYCRRPVIGDYGMVTVNGHVFHRDCTQSPKYESPNIIYPSIDEIRQIIREEIREHLKKVTP